VFAGPPGRRRCLPRVLLRQNAWSNLMLVARSVFEHASAVTVRCSQVVKSCAPSPFTLRALSLLPLLLMVACAERSTPPTELGKFQGTWYSVSTESDGKQQTGEDKADLHIIAGTHCVVRFGGSTVGESMITLEPGEKFGRITFHMTAGQYKNMTWVGIYRADGDTLKWNGGWKTEVATVPSMFATAPGDHYFLRTVRRAKP
jgi:uncharacterized protein (TIGR03067 family)